MTKDNDISKELLNIDAAIVYDAGAMKPSQNAIGDTVLSVSKSE